MMRFESQARRLCALRIVFVLALDSCLSIASLGATSIAGSVRNASRGQPAPGDDVVLLRLDQNIQDEAHAKTNTEGAFTLSVQHPDQPYLVRVIHQGVAYDQRASAGDTLSIRVFDALPKVQGVTGSIEILRAGTDGNFLHVSEMFEVTNESSPPLTQAGERTFEVYLPGNARIDSVLAAGPDRIATMVSAVPVPHEPGHYALNFPLRPGATKFAFNYDLPYRGHATFQTNLAYPLQQLAIMLSPNMKFLSPSPLFETLGTSKSGYQVHAANKLKAGPGPVFTISGAGAIPPLGDQQAKSQTWSQPWAASEPSKAVAYRTNPTVPASAAPILSRTPPYWRSSALALLSAALLALSCAWVWRVRRSRTASR